MAKNKLFGASTIKKAEMPKAVKVPKAPKAPKQSTVISTKLKKLKGM